MNTAKADKKLNNERNIKMNNKKFNKFVGAALSFAILATPTAAMYAGNASTPFLTAKAATTEENVKAVNPAKNEYYRLFRVKKAFIATKNGIVLKQNAAALPNLPNKVFKVYKVGETVALNSKGYDKYGFYIKPYLDCLIALKAAK